MRIKVYKSFRIKYLHEICHRAENNINEIFQPVNQKKMDDYDTGVSEKR